MVAGCVAPVRTRSLFSSVAGDTDPAHQTFTSVSATTASPMVFLPLLAHGHSTTMPSGEGAAQLSTVLYIRLRKGERIGCNELVCPAFPGGPSSCSGGFKRENQST